MTNPTATVRTKPRQRRAQERVDALLDAAASLIERGGLDAVTTTAVAAEAGTSVGGLYRYFEDARAILRGLAARNMDRFWAGIDADPPAGAGRAFLAGVMSRYVAFARAEPGFTALRFGQVLDGYGGERTVSTQIAEIIRQDPSLTARLLRMVNSVYYGLSNSVSNIEEAIFFLGLRQIRELAMATPVIEEMSSFKFPGADARTLAKLLGLEN